MRREARRVAITGVGAVTPMGHGAPALWEGVEAGRSAARRISLFDVADLPVDFACEVPGCSERVGGARARRFACDAAREAWTQAGAPAQLLDPDRIGVSVALGYLGPDSHWFLDYVDWLAALDCDLDPGAAVGAMNELLVSKHGGPEGLGLGLRPERVTQEIAAACGARGPLLTLSTSCPGSLQAAGIGAAAIRDGECDLMLVGGSESMISLVGMMSFARMHALSTNREEFETASRPFDRRRDGFVMGEGAGFLVLEEWESARRRGAEILAEWLGFGLTCDAYRLSDEHPDGLGAIDAIQRAVAAAGISVEEIDYVNAHGSSTQMNDRIETKVLRRTLGARAERIPVSSTKSMIGHLIHASAAVEVITTILGMQRGVVPPTANLLERDPQCDLDYVPGEARALPVRTALKTSFGFGGINAAVVLRRAE